MLVLLFTFLNVIIMGSSFSMIIFLYSFRLTTAGVILRGEGGEEIVLSHKWKRGGVETPSVTRSSDLGVVSPSDCHVFLSMAFALACRGIVRHSSHARQCRWLALNYPSI